MTGKLVTGLLVAGILIVFWMNRQPHVYIAHKAKAVERLWKAPDTNTIPHSEAGDQVRYGRELIVHTSRYLGPMGKVVRISNGMNCQNCHLAAGTKPWGNNYSAVAATYPKYRERSGTMESIEKKINDCLERSLNGKALPDSGREMRAMVAYIQWLGRGIPKGQKPMGAGISKLPYMQRAADTVQGRRVFVEKCQQCHGHSGEGLPDSIAGTGYQYPPLWGAHSFNIGAGIYRLSKLAGYVKDNMPFGASYNNPQLTQQQAWDVAAFITSQTRPYKNTFADWPDRRTKPADDPFGPYADTFSEHQHKYGPFEVIEKYYTLKKMK